MSKEIGSDSTVSAHSLEDLERQLAERERYVELTNRQALGFRLDDADGNAIRLEDFAGKIVVLNFTYARCKDVCPLHSQLIATVQEQINATPTGGLVQFISIATDTEDEAETVDIMRSYAASHGLDPANWLFLHRGAGAPDATIELAKRYGLKFTYTEDGDQMHGVVTHVIDANGVLRARYHGLGFDPTNLTLYVNALANDRHGSQRPETNADNTTVVAMISALSLGLAIAGDVPTAVENVR